VAAIESFRRDAWDLTRDAKGWASVAVVSANFTGVRAASAHVVDVASSAASGAAHPHQSMSCATRLKCVASLVRTRSRQAAPGFVVGRLLLAAGSARVLAAGAGSRRLRVLGFLAIVGCVSRGFNI